MNVQKIFYKILFFWDQGKTLHGAIEQLTKIVFTVTIHYDTSKIGHIHVMK